MAVARGVATEMSDDETVDCMDPNGVFGGFGLVGAGTGDSGHAGGPVEQAPGKVRALGKYPEFKGDVLTVEIRDFWTGAEVSPRSQGYHYNRDAETYMLVGDALGRARVKLV